MFCNTCLKRSKCDKTCPKIDKYLKKQHIYSDDYIRPMVSRLNAKKFGKGKWREIPQSAFKITSDDDPLLNNYDFL